MTRGFADRHSLLPGSRVLPVGWEHHLGDALAENRGGRFAGKAFVPYIRVHATRGYAMITLTVTAKGQVTLRKDLLQHLGVEPGQKIEISHRGGATRPVRIRVGAAQGLRPGAGRHSRCGAGAATCLRGGLKKSDRRKQQCIHQKAEEIRIALKSPSRWRARSFSAYRWRIRGCLVPPFDKGGPGGISRRWGFAKA